jgi:hypothetical protein
LTGVGAFVGHTTGSWRNKVGLVVYLLGDIEISIEGIEVGVTLFHFDGKLEWVTVGVRLGPEVGYFVLGFEVNIVGRNVGEYVGDRVGEYDGVTWVGCRVTCGMGSLMIANVGIGVGMNDGFNVGGSVSFVGFRVIILLGDFEGTMEVTEEGFFDGHWDGLGDSVGVEEIEGRLLIDGDNDIDGPVIVVIDWTCDIVDVGGICQTHLLWTAKKLPFLQLDSPI